ncbi:MAG: hypothetical protein ABI806_06165 [Candidatus Solibacter sp.]
MAIPKLSDEIIAAAIEGFESQKRRIDSQIGELRAMLPGGRTDGTATPEAPRRKRRVSAAARRRMAEGQRKRWAGIKAGSKEVGSTTGSEAAKPKRKISAAGRRAISEATKRRWALKRAEAAKKAPKAAKKTVAKATGKAATAEAVAQ